MDAASHSRCPVCDAHDARHLLDLGDLPVFVNVLHSSAQASLNTRTGPVRLLGCRVCGHVWNPLFDPALLEYDGEYDAALDFSPTFREFAAEMIERLTLAHHLDQARGVVADIGCGKGEFLIGLCERTGARGLGFDPSYSGDTAIGSATFRRKLYEPGDLEGQTVELISCRHVLEHVVDPEGLTRDLVEAARPSQAPIYLEVPDGLFTVRDLSLWDVIYEHCSYFTPSSLERLARQADMTVQQMRSVYGGQFLAVDGVPGASQPDRSESPSEAEIQQALAAFPERASEHLGRWREALAGRDGSDIVWGAGSKGVTFLNLVGGEAIRGVVDINPRKHGRYVPGTDLAVMAPAELRSDPPARILVMNPIYAAEIKVMLKELDLDVPLELVH